MKRAVIASTAPWKWLPQLSDYSIMVVNPDCPKSRFDYLIANSDYSLLITDHSEKFRDGADYPGERIYFYTSGTTGDSKFYGFSQMQLDTICDVMIASYEITANDRYYGVMPMWHAHGQTWYWVTQRVGCQSEFGGVGDLRRIQTLQPTFLSAVPKILRATQRLHLEKLRFLRSASVAMSQTTYRGLRDRFKVPVLEAFGMTESISHCFTNPLHGVQKAGTVGLPDGIQARVDQHQHLWIKGPCVHQQDWIDTGDLASVDDDGYYTILGRHIDQININGYKINPLSVESQLVSLLPEITEVVVFGDHELNCYFTGDVSTKNVEACLTTIHPYCRPKVLERLEQIPCSPSGKISRSWLTSRLQKSL